MELKITPSGQTIVKPTALGPVANTDSKLLIYGLFQKGRVLAQDGMSAIVMTLPITLTLVLEAGYDKIWFGVFLVLVVEMAQITPPVGLNLFVIQTLTGERIGVIARAAFPFFMIMALFTMLLALFPEVVMFLPDRVTLGGGE